MKGLAIWSESQSPPRRIAAARTVPVYEGRLRQLATQFPKLVTGVDGSRHLGCLRFRDTRTATDFAKLLVERGLDISTQAYKPDCPPSVLTKLPLIAGYEVVDFTLDRMTAVLRGMEQ